MTAALAAFSIILQSLEHQEKLVEVTNWPLRFEFRRDKRHPDALVMLLALAYETLQFLTSEKKRAHLAVKIFDLRAWIFSCSAAWFPKGT